MPELLSGAPTTAVDLAMASEKPKLSPGAPSEAVSVICCGQVLPERSGR